MAGLYADEGFDFRVVVELRRLGHDVLTVQEAGQGNQGIEDAEVLAFAVGKDRAVLTFNRRDFINLHRLLGSHRGIVVVPEIAIRRPWPRVSIEKSWPVPRWRIG